jgi:hypothetical protein
MPGWLADWLVACHVVLGAAAGGRTPQCAGGRLVVDAGRAVRRLAVLCFAYSLRCWR